MYIHVAYGPMYMSLQCLLTNRDVPLPPNPNGHPSAQPPSGHPIRPDIELLEIALPEVFGDVLRHSLNSRNVA